MCVTISARCIYSCFICCFVADDGFNIPCIQECQEIADGLSDIEILRKKQPATLPPLPRRLVNDASICIYVDPEMEMY